MTNQLHNDIVNHYSEKQAEQSAWIERFIDLYKQATAGDESAMEECRAMYESKEALEYNAQLSAAMAENGLA